MHSARESDRPQDSPAKASRRDLVAGHLARSDQYWDKAVTELREALVAMASDVDDLDKRVRDLESHATNGSGSRLTDPSGT